MNIQTLKDIIVPVLERAGVTRSAVFGSVARGEARENSDLDLLVELPSTKSLLDFIDLKLELEDITKKKVDLVEYGAIKPSLREYVLANQISIL